MEQEPTFASNVLSFAQSPVGAFCVGFLVLLSSFANYLTYNAYPVFAPETGLAVLIFAAAAACLAVLYKAVPSFVRLLLVLLLLYVGFGLNMDGYAAAFGPCIALLLLRDYTLPIMGTMALTILASNAVQLASHGATADATYVQASGQSSPEGSLAQNDELPTLLHIILDAHIGVEGLANDGGSEEAIAGEIKRFYADNGFHLFGGAYATNRNTRVSVPSMLNRNEDYELFQDKIGMGLENNRYFDYLGSRGYRISVYEPEWLDYCRNQFVVDCKRRREADPRPMIDSSLSISDKVIILVSQFASLSQVLLEAASYYDKLVLWAQGAGYDVRPLQIDKKSKTSTLGALLAFDDLIRDLQNAEPGRVYFAHFLLPHAPFALTADCQYKSPWDWQVESSPFAPVSVRQAAYVEQTHCTQTKLRSVLDALQSSPAAANNIVVIHGDHGSRVTRLAPLSENVVRFTAEDIISTYSTLFAVRGKGIKSGYDSRRIPLHLLLAGLVDSDFSALEVDSTYPLTVNLADSAGNELGERELPPSWANPPAR